MIEIEKKILDAFNKVYKKCKNERTNSKFLRVSNNSLMYTNDYLFIKLEYQNKKIDIPANANFDLSDFDKLIKNEDNYSIQDYLLDFGTSYPDVALDTIIDNLSDEQNFECLYYFNDLRFIFDFAYSIINITTAKKENVKVKFNLSNRTEPALFIIESKDFKISIGLMPVMR